mmetsp:Transcript_25900/g.62394  ORF Transcript_25900/g.62394 Transcript_25900/m.62394 type:complete len:687 (-) Transcript_25900:469-2529(-)
MGETLSKCFVDAGELPEDGFGFIQLLTLLFGYGYIIILCAQGIGDGCELLMAYSPRMASLVGPVVLPILGAVPDSMIILASGLGEDAQEKLNVGVGALAGSTIMLLTIPWFVVILAGRVDLDENGRGTYKGKHRNAVTPGMCPSSRTGINVTDLVPKSGKVMMLTSLSYLVMQIPALLLGCGYEGSNCDPAGERWWALATLLCCILGFIGYIWYCINVSGSDVTAPIWLAVYERLVDAGSINLIDASQYLASQQGNSAVDVYTLVNDSLKNNIHALTRRFWNRVDKTHSGRNLTKEGFKEFLDLVHISLEDRFNMTHRMTEKKPSANDHPVSLKKVVDHVYQVVQARQMLLNSFSPDSLMSGLSPKSSTPLSERNLSLYELAFKISTKNDIYLKNPKEAIANIQNYLDPIWQENSKDGSGQIDVESFNRLCPTFGMSSDDKRILFFLATVDRDHDDLISTQEMANFLFDTVTSHLKHPVFHETERKETKENKNEDSKAHEEDGENEEEEDEDFELPNEIAKLPESERKAAILKSALVTIFVSTVGVILVSDPLTDVMAQMGKRMNISSFYISFVLSPLASNGSELGAAYTLASRKTVAKATAGVSQLLGAGSMNNTMCLGVFVALIFLRELKWTFTAETISILVSEVVTALIGMKTTQTLFDGFLILSVYPFSLALVIGLEAAGLQ